MKIGVCDTTFSKFVKLHMEKRKQKVLSSVSSVRPLPLRYIRMSNGKKKDTKHEDLLLKHCPQQQSLKNNDILCKDPETAGHDEPHRIKLTGRTSDVILLYVFLKQPLPLKKCKVKRTGTSPNVYKNNEPHSRQLRKLHSVIFRHGDPNLDHAQ